MADITLALHGIQFALPDGWELAGLSGEAHDGWALLAQGRTPVARISWHRQRHNLDAERQVARLQRELVRSAHCTAFNTLPTRSSSLRLVSGQAESGTWQAAVFVHSEHQIMVSAVALTPNCELAEIFAHITTHAHDAVWPWRFHGIDIELPAWWRLTGVQHYAGLVRALWQHRTPEQRTPDALLVLRRIACATRVLNGATPLTWASAGLDRNESVNAEQLSDDGISHLSVTRPAASWWRRWRGECDRREIHVWLDSDTDRLMVQEWRGSGEALPALRRITSALLVNA